MKMVKAQNNDYCPQYNKLTQAIMKDVSNKKLQHWLENGFLITNKTQLDQEL